MKRRSFLQRSSTLSLPLMLGGWKVSAVGRSRFFNFLNNDNDRVLVLIQLNGGNDGLHTLIPLDQYDTLANLRSNIILPESSLLSVDDTRAFHPSMANLKELYDDGKMHILQSVGYPDQNRSHFRSTDIWSSGSDAATMIPTGWLGRYFENDHAGYPEGYPNGESPDPFAITFGSAVSETCQGTGANFSLALVDPDNLGALPGGVGDDLPPGCYGEELDFIRTTIEQSNAYSSVLLDAIDKGNSMSTKYPEDNRLANQLKIIAQLISGGLQTKVYVVSLGGFDTHGNQVSANDPTAGEHATLLKILSDAMCAFQDDLRQLGLEERVLGMTVSEFGRQIRSNGSMGTDHGNAAPLMVFGSCVNPAILGDNPEISPDTEVQEGVPMQYDFRSVYGSVLMDWFGASEDLVRTILFNDFQHLPIISDCRQITDTTDLILPDFDLKVFPSPFEGSCQIELTTEAERVRVSISNAIGSEVRVLADRTFQRGTHRLTFDAHKLAPGSYFVRVQNDHTQKTKKIVKVR